VGVGLTVAVEGGMVGDMIGGRRLGVARAVACAAVGEAVGGNDQKGLQANTVRRRKDRVAVRETLGFIVPPEWVAGTDFRRQVSSYNYGRPYQ
jgi:uncharacterized protein YcfJ